MIAFLQQFGISPNHRRRIQEQVILGCHSLEPILESTITWSCFPGTMPTNPLPWHTLTRIEWVRNVSVIVRVFTFRMSCSVSTRCDTNTSITYSDCDLPPSLKKSTYITYQGREC